MSNIAESPSRNTEEEKEEEGKDVL